MASGGRSRTGSALLVLVLLAALVVAVVALRLPGAVDLPGVGGQECTVTTADGEVGIDRDEARRATTSVALTARGEPGPDVADIDDAVLARLTEGPPDDAGPSLSCRGAVPDDLAVEGLTDTGLTPRADRVRAEMAEVFGDLSLGGFAPGGVQRAGESTHNEGRAVDVFFQPVTEENRRRGWHLAHWLVAHADHLDVQYVIFDDRVWSARTRRGAWQRYDAPAPADEILRHLDHVHVDVFRGG